MKVYINYVPWLQVTPVLNSNGFPTSVYMVGTSSTVYTVIPHGEFYGWGLS